MAAATKAKNRVSANGDGVKPDDKVERLVITPPNLVTGAFNIEGDSPLVIHRFGQKAIEQMKAKQEAGSQATKGRKREPKDFQECFQQSRHISLEGWDGIPAGGFRAAMVDACRLASFKMTVAKLSVFIIADGLDRVDKTGLVRITKGEARYTEHAVRNETGVCDIRARAMFDPGWQATVRIRFDGDQFSLSDVANLLARVGAQVGLCEGRANSPNGTGMGWGSFFLLNG